MKKKLKTLYAMVHYFVTTYILRRNAYYDSYLSMDCDVCGKTFWTIHDWGVDPTIGIMCESCYAKYLKEITPEKSLQMFLDWFIPRCADDVERFEK